MSFGFSVGDFLAVIGLVTQLRKDFSDAPSQLRDLSAELKTFSIVLQDTEVDLPANELDSRQLEALESTLTSAREFLKDLQRFIDNNKEIPKSTGSTAKVNLKRIWKRLNFDQREVSKFRHQLTSIISGLQMFTANEVKHNTRKIARYVDKQEHRDALKWLSDDDFHYYKNYQSHLVRNRQPGTRKWLLGSTEWKIWLKVAGQTLYCPGIPGSGKTFTTAMVIENMGSLSEEHGWVFAYIFCNYQQRKENMCEMILRSLLRMVLEQTHEISDEVQRWPTRNKEISIGEIMEQLRISIQGCPRVFFMVDALDELDVFQDLVPRLFDLQEAVGVNLYFTSRKLPHIQMLFDKALIVPIKATEHDVGVYLENQMRKPHVPGFVRSNRALQDEIKETVVNAAGEMFLLADLQLVQLLHSRSPRLLRDTLKAITSGISTYEATYEKAMDRIKSQDQWLCELATNAISILAYAERPLLAPELVHALSVDLDIDGSSDNELYRTMELQSMIESLGVYDPDLMPSIKDVVAASAGLIVHQPDSGIVQLVHKTTKEYLMSDNGRQKWFPRAQFTIAAICLVYLQAFDGSEDAADWPFLDYAQKHYGHHIMAQQSLDGQRKSATVRSSLHESAVDSFETSPGVAQAQSLMDQIGLTRMALELGATESVLILACETNQLNFARVLLATKQYNRPSRQVTESNIESPYAMADCAIDRALLAATRNGHLELVDILLKNGASPMIEEYPSRMSLLALASSRGHCKLVSHFLDQGYFTLAMMRHDQDNFFCVIESGVESRHISVKSPICHAALSGHVLCVKVLFEWIETEAKMSGREAERERVIESVTVCAIARHHVHVLERLPRLSTAQITNMVLSYGDPSLLFTVIGWANTGIPDDDNACGMDAVTMFFLRTYTFDLSVGNTPVATALDLAAEHGMTQVIRLILEQHEDLLNAQDHWGRTALSRATQEASNSRQLNSIKMLLGYTNIKSELVDINNIAPIDHLLQTMEPLAFEDDPNKLLKMHVLSLMVQSLEHGIHRLDCHGSTLLHSLIDASYVKSRVSTSWAMHRDHWSMLEHYEGRRIFERRKVLEHTVSMSRQFDDLDSDDSDYDNSDDFLSYSPRFNASNFRHALSTMSVSADEIRSSPCKCGIGTIFLAISTENLGIVEVLLDLCPDLVNDRFFDGSSPLDLASCIVDPRRRQAMIDLILSKNPIVQTYKSDTQTVEISESDPFEAQEGCSVTDLELDQRQRDHTKDEIDD